MRVGNFIVIPGRATDLGLARDRRSKNPKSAKADLGGASPESMTTALQNGFRARRFAASRNDGIV